MSYQFDATRLRTNDKAITSREAGTVRLLSRRTVRQNRRALRAI